MTKQRNKKITHHDAAEILNDYNVVSAFLGWLEEEDISVLNVDDLEELARSFATDNDDERAFLDELLEELA